VSIGCLVAQEMGWPSPPAFQFAPEKQARLSNGVITLHADGSFAILTSKETVFLPS
jgi:hypothetical protein